MSKSGARLIAAAQEAVAVARGEALPAAIHFPRSDEEKYTAALIRQKAKRMKWIPIASSNQPGKKGK